jgi:NAD(P)-dependent dehydrogenase (short-subunit alcohol dehydrogenase family)
MYSTATRREFAPLSSRKVLMAIALVDELQGRIALVTAASRGIGRHRLGAGASGMRCRSGYQRAAIEAAEVVAETHALKCTAMTVQADVADPT